MNLYRLAQGITGRINNIQTIGACTLDLKDARQFLDPGEDMESAVIVALRHQNGTWIVTVIREGDFHTETTQDLLDTMLQMVVRHIIPKED